MAPGDVLCEVETDKATIAWEAQEEGFIAAILLQDGSKDVAVGTPAAVIVEDEVSEEQQQKQQPRRDPFLALVAVARVRQHSLHCHA